jgi:hypothetical protein
VATNILSSANELIESARKATGLTDLGDSNFQEGLSRLVDSVNTEVDLSATGKEALEARFKRLIMNWLRFTADLTAHPEILNETLLPPVVILGLPRVGSTKLHRMLGASGTFQDPLFWQVYNPSRMTTGTVVGEDPRIEEARRFVEFRNKNAPGANAGHRISVFEVEEESYLLEFACESVFPMSYISANSYYEWLQSRDQSKTYKYLGQFLQYLQWQFHKKNPRPWILKSPPNLGWEKQIQSFASQARFVMSHRDPVVIVASISAVANQSHKMYCGEYSAKEIGAWVLREFSACARRHIAWRKANPHLQVCDFAYADVERRPMEVAKQCYESGFFTGQRDPFGYCWRKPVLYPVTTIRVVASLM